MDVAEYLKALGEHLRRIRKQRKVSLRELELRGDVSRHIISEIENGKRDIRVTTLKKIIHALYISEQEFWADFKMGERNTTEDLITEAIQKVVKLLPFHNDTIQLRNILQNLSDLLLKDSSNQALARFLLVQRKELYECLNQAGLDAEQEKHFMSIKKKILTKLNENRSK
ncbi:MAG: helix-turn-helix domain-containing protein [Cytophagaceae bacterium]